MSCSGGLETTILSAVRFIQAQSGRRYGVKGGLLARTIGVVIYPFMVSVEKGADTFIWLASSDDSASVNADGNYFYQRRKVKIAAHATDADAERLWDVSEELVRPFV